MNNFVADDVFRLQALHTQTGMGVEYHAFQHEVGEEGTHHLQGYIAFKTRIARATVSRRIPRAFLEPTRGTPEEAAAYCKNPTKRQALAHDGIGGDFHFEWGTLPVDETGQGRRNEIIAFKHELDAGKSTGEVAKDDAMFGTFCKYSRSLSAYEVANMVGRVGRSNVIVIWGDSGTYKSAAAKRFPKLYSVERSGSTVWFDGYEPNLHETALIDEFYGWLPYGQLLRLTDRDMVRVETKGGSKIFKPRFIVFTSNAGPEDWYKYDGVRMQYAALQRRIDGEFRVKRLEAAMGPHPAGSIRVSRIRGKWAMYPLIAFVGFLPEPEIEDQHFGWLDEKAVKAELFHAEPMDQVDWLGMWEQ